MAIVAKINTRNMIGRATVTTPRNTTIVSQNYTPKPNVALVELTDVSVPTVKNGYIVQYSSEIGKFELAPIANASINLTNIQGGLF